MLDTRLQNDCGKRAAGVTRRALERGHVADRHVHDISAHRVRHTVTVAAPVVPSEVTRCYDAIASCVRPRQPHSGGNRFGAALEELRPLRALDYGAEPLGK